MKTAVQSAITQPLFLAIDEAQYLNTGSPNDIKMLMNYGCDYDSVPSDTQCSSIFSINIPYPLVES